MLQCITDGLSWPAYLFWQFEDREKVENSDADGEKARISDVFRRFRNKMRFVKGEQQRWKGQVQEQREHIYDKRTILN